MIEGAPPAPTTTSINDAGLAVSEGVDVGRGLNDIESCFLKEEVKPLHPSRPITAGGMQGATDEFFARPVILTTKSISGASLGVSLCDWTNWLNEPMIKQRLKGWSLLRGTLNLKFDFSPAPQHYGMSRVYWRYGVYEYAIMGGAFATSCLGVDLDYSRPGSHELSIPWIFPVDHFALTTNDTSLYAPTGGGTDPEMFGQLMWQPIVPLARVDSVTPGTIQLVVRGWVTDLRLIGPTRYENVAQSGGGPISGVAMSFSRAAGELEKVPIIGGVAKTVKGIAGFVADVASLFGFSRERHDAVNKTQRGVTSYALTDVPVACDSLAFTSKQQIDMSPAPFGDEFDDMALSRIHRHPSLLVAAGWPTTSTRGTVIYEIPVNPCYSTVAVSSFYDMSNLCAGTLPFKFWRGSIVYTFKLVCSQFHTGAVRVVYDPVGKIGDTEDTTWPMGAIENCIVNLTPGGVTTITVNYTSKDFWRPVSHAYPGNVVPAASIGTLRVLVEAPLQATISTADAWMAIYVQGGSDFEVFGINNRMPRYGLRTAFAPGTTSMASIAPPSEEADEAEKWGMTAQATVNASACTTTCSFGGIPHATLGSLTGYVFGERIVSLRALLKRYVPYGYIKPTSDPAPTLQRKAVYPCMPLYPTEFSCQAGSGNGLVYLDHQNLMRWFRVAYLGVKGGVRLRVVDGTKSIDAGGAVTYPSLISVANNYTAVSLMAASIPDIQATVPNYAGVGSALYDGALQEMLDIEVPDYNPDSFHYCLDRGGVVLANSRSNTIIMSITKPSVNATNWYYGVSWAAADDFSLFHFQGFPLLAPIV